MSENDNNDKQVQKEAISPNTYQQNLTAMKEKTNAKT